MFLSLGSRFSKRPASPRPRSPPRLRLKRLSCAPVSGCGAMTTSAYRNSAEPPCIAVSCDSSASWKGPGSHRPSPARCAARPLTCLACNLSTLVFTVAKAASQEMAKQRCIHSDQRVVVSSWWRGVGASLRKRTNKVFCASCRCKLLFALRGGTGWRRRDSRMRILHNPGVYPNVHCCDLLEPHWLEICRSTSTAV